MRTLLLLTLLLAGCMSIPADPTKMDEGQLREWVKDKNASVTCASGKTVTGNITLVAANLDKGTMQSGGNITIDANCVVTISSDAKPVPVVSLERPAAQRPTTTVTTPP